jgi:hypothetical protein
MPINENSVFTQRFNMVMLPEERAMLQRLAEDAGAKESALIRQWIGEAYSQRFGKRKPGDVVPKYNSADAREAKAKTRKR